MGFSVECDECEEEITDEKVYCSKCFLGSKKETAKCCVCHGEFAKNEMFSKIAGNMCHHCAFLYEAEAAGLLPKKKNAA